MVWYSHLLKNFPQFIVIHTIKGFGIVNKAEIDIFLELSCFFHDPADVGRRQWHPTPVLLPGKSHGWRSLVDHSPWGRKNVWGFPGGSDSKETACNAGDPGSIPGSGRFPWRRECYPPQYSCWENSTDRGPWRATVHGVTKNRHD